MRAWRPYRLHWQLVQALFGLFGYPDISDAKEAVETTQSAPAVVFIDGNCGGVEPYRMVGRVGQQRLQARVAVIVQLKKLDSEAVRWRRDVAEEHPVHRGSLSKVVVGTGANSRSHLSRLHAGDWIEYQPTLADLDFWQHMGMRPLRVEADSREAHTMAE